MTTTTTAPNTPAALAQCREADANTVRRWLASGEAVVIDVREPDEHARERIDGTRLMPLSRFDPQALASLTGKKVVVHCKSGRRSAEACRLASATLPRVEVHNLTGGIEAWKQANLPVVVNARAPGISVMRQVQLTIGLGVAIGTALGAFVDPLWLALPAFFGAGLMFAGATGTCGLAAVMARMPWNRGARSPSECSSGSCG